MSLPIRPKYFFIDKTNSRLLQPFIGVPIPFVRDYDKGLKVLTRLQEDHDVEMIEFDMIADAERYVDPSYTEEYSISSLKVINKY